MQFSLIFGKSKQYFISLSVIGAVSAVCFLFSNFLGYHFVALILLVTVSLFAIAFDIIPVLLSAGLSAFIWNFFFIPPRFTIHIDTSEDTILFIMYFIIAMVSGILTFKIRQLEKVSRLKEEKANSVKLYNTILDSLSHELRTPITAIIIAADNLQTNNRLTKENRDQLITEISTASLRLNQQVENLLNISRLESGHIQPKYDWVDIGELVHQIAKTVEEKYSARRINVNINPNLPICSLDKGMVEQIIHNLLSNAAIHTPQDCRIDILASCHGDLLEIIVQDSGVGLIGVNPDSIFKKFSRNNTNKTNGSGLGLSIVQGFTEALNGKVALNRSEYGGAKFVVALPVKTI